MVAAADVREGETGASAELAALFDEEADFVFRVVRRHGVPESAADDVVQEVFLVLHRRLRDFDGRTSLRSWLYGIARRVAAAWLRGETRAQVRQQRARRATDPPSLDDQLAVREALQLLEEVLSRMSDERREVFVLAEVEGMRGPEIADALGINVNTVYSRLREARIIVDKAVARHVQKAGAP